ncbi:MAG: DUF2828 family protein [Synergistaceae bacterium]|nr:DUF2828 family protein [Synergistaceae bacterium]MBQ6114434.1 DUF2828 family protein [Synergistaceae bacterium]MBQ6665198.1 DUF2828 family protein [Synergistaceae bacterium]MBQ6982937.1 DUF2828 family protein [Synergistaceae bacterium]
MLKQLKEEANYTLTENLALTHKSTLSDCLDLFATIGALRNSHPGEIITRFMRAFTEDRDMAAKIAFYGRDIRGGLGERRTFRVILQWLAENSPSTISKNISLIPEYGRYDDILELLGTKCEQSALSLIASQLKSDMDSESPSLLAKWLPSVNASSSETRQKALAVAKTLGMSLKDYRQTLSKLRAKLKIIENNLRTKDYTFDYSKQPSKAMFKYRAAFSRNDNERYMAFLDDVSAGKATLHTGTLTPYEIIRPILDTGLNADEINAINTTWNAQEDFTNGENAIVVVDGSGSMYGGRNVSPISVALSLGIYFAERNKGEFHNHFITFSMTPQLVEIKGANIYEKVKYCASFNEVANTNIQAVFELILSTAVKHNVPQSELPSTIYIISDMEFDYCNNADITNFDYAKKIFAEHGYKLPNVVFWNVESRNTQQPVTMNEQGVTLVSGASPRVFAMIKSGNLSPMSFMLDVLNSERYRNITA